MVWLQLSPAQASQATAEMVVQPSTHELNSPCGILLDKDDNLLIADSNNDVIRKVGSDGIIHTIAGNGQEGYDGDGGPARAAKLNTPQSLAVDAAGRIYIGDEHNDAIRVLELDGTIRTFIGSKGPGFSGDGGPASRGPNRRPGKSLGAERRLHPD